MKMEKLFLSLLLVLTVSVVTFAMPPDNNNFEKGNRDCNKFEKKFCPSQFQGCEMFMLLGLGPEIKNESKYHNFKKECDFKKECNLRFIKDLSQAQKDRIKQISESNREINETIRADIKNKFDELDKELSKDNYSKKTITKLTKEINLLCNKKIAAKVSEKQQIRDVLTSKQFSKMITEPSKYDIFAERLNLTQEQQEKIESLFEKNKKELEILKKDLTDKKAALEEEFNKEVADFNFINKLSTDISELSKNKFQIIVDTKAELKKILNSEQFNKLIKGKKEPRPIPVPQPIKPKLEEK